MIKICHMTSVHKRYDGRIFQKECISLKELGYEVHLVVSDDRPDEINNDVQIHSAGYVAKSRLGRMTKAARKVYELAKAIDAEVYHFHDPELMEYGVKLVNQGKKVIFDSHEHTIVQILSKKYLIVPELVSKLFALYQREVVEKLSAVITPTPQLVEMFREMNPRSYLVTNYPKLENLPSIIDKKKQVCFTGSCSSQWKLENVAEAVAGLDCEFVIAGSGSDRYIKSVIEKGKGKVKYVGQLGKADVYRLQAESIAGMVVNYGEQTIAEGGTLGNTKMFEYMMNGTPIICTNFPLWKDVVDKDSCGICVDANNVDEIRNVIKQLIDNMDEGIRMGLNARKAVEREYNWATQIDNLKDAYAAVLDS